MMVYPQLGVAPSSGRGWYFAGVAAASAVPVPTPIRRGVWLFGSAPLWGGLGFGCPVPFWGGLGIGYPVLLWSGLWYCYSGPLWDGDRSLGDTSDLFEAAVFLAR